MRRWISRRASDATTGRSTSSSATRSTRKANSPASRNALRRRAVCSRTRSTHRRAASAFVSRRISDAFQLPGGGFGRRRFRSEEHTSELQSQSNLVCRLLLEKKKKKKNK